MRKTKSDIQLSQVYVDDLSIAWTSKERVVKFISELQQQFPIKNLGPLKHFHDIHVKGNQTVGIVSLSNKNLFII